MLLECTQLTELMVRDVRILRTQNFMHNWPTCAELAIVCRINKAHRKCEILQILFSSVALSSALTAAEPAQTISVQK